MRCVGPVTAEGRLHPAARSCSARVRSLSFGRKRIAAKAPLSPLLSSDDVRLFLNSYAVGLIFIAVLIA